MGSTAKPGRQGRDADSLRGLEPAQVGRALALLAVRKNQWAGRFGFGWAGLILCGYLQFNVWRVFGVLTALVGVAIAVSAWGWYRAAREFRRVLPIAREKLDLPRVATLEPLSALEARGITVDVREVGDPLTRSLTRLPPPVWIGLLSLLTAATVWVALHP